MEFIDNLGKVVCKPLFQDGLDSRVSSAALLSRNAVPECLGITEGRPASLAE